MNSEERDALAQLAANRIQRNLADNEDLANLLNVLSKPVLDAKPLEKPTLEEINSLIAFEKVSEKGPYKIINKAENINNLAYEKLHVYIAEHNGFVTLHGLKCWIFSNN